MNETKPITVVCGFPRCGTSLTMRLLYEAGMPCHAESFDVAFEHEDVKGLPNKWTWLKRCFGKAVKILDPQIYILPRGLRYDFIWIDRNPVEQAKSQVKFLRMLSGLSIPSDRESLKRLSDSLVRDRPLAVSLLEQYPNSRLLKMKFESLIEQSEGAVSRLSDFVGLPVSGNAIVARSTKCYAGMLELSLMESLP